ncbi:hypothetical protein BDN70DRAFT_30179 [Pholiota conissans]|uniref:Uncharacterized protein n=1 Tax=Pholiota conissans TaxID=109636 RepID=A0A9P6CSW0_9AGAR|nr:hypothetical protein BDN70DRAFT_30179 [Pholiota conissans]
MKTLHKNGDGTLAVLPAIGFLFNSALYAAEMSFKSFRRTGITKLTVSQSHPTPYVKSTSLYSVSGKNFSVHCGTNPITAFTGPRLSH